MVQIDLLYCLDARGLSPFQRWFDGLDAQTAAKVNTVFTRMQSGNFANVKGIGAGVLEFRLDYGPGYRIYFGREGNRIIILLGGGSKKRQSADILRAKTNWQLYKQRKKLETR